MDFNEQNGSSWNKKYFYTLSAYTFLEEIVIVEGESWESKGNSFSLTFTSTVSLLSLPLLRSNEFE